MSENKISKKSELQNDFSEESPETDSSDKKEYGSELTSSIGYMPEEEKKKQTLEIGDKSNFLLKTGLLFIIYFLAWGLGIISRNAIKNDSFVYVKLIFWIIICLFIFSFSIKLVFGLFGKYIRNLSLFFYILDCFFIFFIILGIKQFFLRLIEKNIPYLDFTRPFFNLAGINGLLNSICFTVSTIWKNDKGGYSPLWGLLLVIPSSFISILTIPFFHKNKIHMNLIHIIIFYVLTVIINIYFVIDLWLISKKRTKKFFLGDYPLAFFSVWFDWSFKFWRYLFRKGDIIDDKKIDFASNDTLNV